jgi:hypothetical protein
MDFIYKINNMKALCIILLQPADILAGLGRSKIDVVIFGILPYFIRKSIYYSEFLSFFCGVGRFVGGVMEGVNRM